MWAISSSRPCTYRGDRSEVGHERARSDTILRDRWRWGETGRDRARSGEIARLGGALAGPRQPHSKGRGLPHQAVAQVAHLRPRPRDRRTAAAAAASAIPAAASTAAASAAAASAVPAAASTAAAAAADFTAAATCGGRGVELLEVVAEGAEQAECVPEQPALDEGGARAGAHRELGRGVLAQDDG